MSFNEIAFNDTKKNGLRREEEMGDFNQKETGKDQNEVLIGCLHLAVKDLIGVQVRWDLRHEKFFAK